MNNVSLISFYKHPRDFSGNIFKTFKPGQIIKAQVIDVTQDGLLLTIGANKFQASTHLKLPVGSKLNLFVISNNDEKLVLSINEFKTIPIKNLLDFLGYEETNEIKSIIAKFVKNKIKISKNNIDKGKQLASQLPLSIEDGIDIITDPNLYAAIFSQFSNFKDGYAIFLNKNTKSDNEQAFQISIILTTEELGSLLIDIKWDIFLNIEFYCTNRDTFDTLENNVNILKKKLAKTGDISIKVFYEENLFSSDISAFDNIQLKGVDIFA